MAQGRRAIQAALAAAGLRPLKRYGQNFLIDDNLMRKLVAAAGITARDVVLEVGAGTGALTDYLLLQAGRVVVVEIDRGLHALCAQRFAGRERITLLHRDVLERKSVVAGEVLDVIAAWHRRLDGRIMLVANLPYQVATPLIVNLLTGPLFVSPLCFTVQAEVAERMTAAPGGKTYGPLSVIVQALATCQRVARLPPEVFWPEPKVSSMMLRLDRREAGALDPTVTAKLVALVHGCFNHRRKTLKFSLQRMLGEETFAALRDAGAWDVSARPERLSVDAYIAMARFVIEREAGERGERGSQP